MIWALGRLLAGDPVPCIGNQPGYKDGGVSCTRRRVSDGERWHSNREKKTLFLSLCLAEVDLNEVRPRTLFTRLERLIRDHQAPRVVIPYKAVVLVDRVQSTKRPGIRPFLVLAEEAVWGLSPRAAARLTARSPVPNIIHLPRRDVLALRPAHLIY
ncbi:hypothetical protein HDV57DRAFT_501468 [Trichoderma longibrachiatum]|uniref:Uncharacterized protein n=1 Tax=Trichoderma longibrachiatum ATCC 18648 TaxID=983965 RepID=A0A2T4C784_TRILO|nr:hypothetical protein M440DRAFT_279522 [Trichoderma longibrachiatum ATCC 18648]